MNNLKTITWDIEYLKLDGSGDYYSEVRVVGTFNNKNSSAPVGMVGEITDKTTGSTKFRRFLYSGVIEMRVH